MIDVGAGVGDFTIMLLKNSDVDRVIAVEPSEDFLLLQKNLMNAGVEEKVLAFNQAAGDVNGRIPLFKDRYFLSAFPTGETRGSRDAIAYLPCVKLDSLKDQFKISNLKLIKIDTEGSELKILQGSTRLLRVFKPRIIVEVHSEELRQNVLSFLGQMRYRVVAEKINFHRPLISVLYLQPNYQGTDVTC